MHIPKPLHSLLAGALGGVAAVAIVAVLHERIGLWAVLIALVCFPLVWLLGSIVVDLADGALRRVTRQPQPRRTRGGLEGKRSAK